MDLMPPIDRVALVARQADDDEADDRLFGAAARERSVVDEPRAEAGGAAADRPGVPRQAEQGERRHSSDHESRRRAARLRPAEDQPDLHAARGLSRRARRRRDERAVGRRSDLSRERHPPEDLAHVAARHLPEPARLSVARVGADVLGVRGVGPHPLGRDARLLDDARLVDAGLRLAGRRAVPAAQGRADEAAEHDHRVREGGARRPSRSTRAPTSATSATASISTRRTSSSISPTAC